MRKPVLLLAAALVAAASTGAAASPPPPVQVGNGGCGANYDSALNVQTVHVCTRAYDPDVQVPSSPCPGGYFSVGSAVAGRWVCVKI